MNRALMPVLALVALTAFISDGLMPGRAQAATGVCEAEILAAARAHGVPPGILHSVGLTETGRKGSLYPYALNIEGRTVYARSRREALAEFERARAEGKTLIAANIVGVSEKSDAQLDASAKEQLTGWFGEEVRAWNLLRVDRIPHALPRQTPGVLEPVAREFVTDSSVIVCGDHLANTSLNGAMESGRRASELALRAG